jgi:hypothetical protein
MADEPTSSGWLPPRAPGGQPPPRFEMVVPPAPAPTPEPPAPAPEPPATVPTAGRGPAGPPRFDHEGPQTNGLALAALLLGVIGIGLLVITAGIGAPLALPCSIAAWICGAQARTRIALGEETTGRGQAHAGYLLGLAGVVLGVAAAVGWGIWLANGGDFEELRRDLERYRDEQSREAAIGAARALLGR